jgi:hypothetical protein
MISRTSVLVLALSPVLSAAAAGPATPAAAPGIIAVAQGDLSGLVSGEVSAAASKDVA